MAAEPNSNENPKRAELPIGHSLLGSNEPRSRPSGISILLEFKRRRQAGEAITAQQFVAQSHVPDDPEIIVDIVFAEFLEAEKNGDSAAGDRLCEQFPNHAQEIRRQIYFHQALTRPGNITAIGGTTESLNDFGFETGVDDETPIGESLHWLSIPGLDLLKPLGRGGMGVVYLAHQPKLNRKVAVKLLLGGTFASTSHRARFRAEAQAAASLRHPNIVQIDEVGESQGQPFLVMEYVDGGTLEQFIKKQNPSPRESAEFVKTLALAVHQAHLLGIIHRDLKPGNILLSRRDGASDKKSPTISPESTLSDLVPKIADFGLAKVLGDEQALSGPALTMAGDMLGTPSYMAPEQTNNDQAGPWTDVYALGAILYQLLSGRPPFLSTTPWETLQQVLEDEPRALPRSVPVDLRTICLKCLRKQPSARYTSMNLFASDLQRFLEDKPIAARSSTALERTAAWCRRNKTIAVLGSTVFIALFSILGLTIWSRTQLAESLNATELSRRGEAAAHRKSMEHLWESLIAKARAQQATGRIGQRVNSLAAVKDAKELIDEVGRTPARVAALRDTAAASLPLPDINKIAKWKGLPVANDGRTSADRTLNRVAQLTSDQKIIVTEDFGSVRIAEIEAEDADHLVLSPDGRWLAAWRDKVWLYDLQQSPPEIIVTRLSGGWWGFTPASDKLVGSDNAALIVLDLETLKIEQRLLGLNSIVPLAFSGDNRKVALVQGDSLLVIDIVTGEKIGDFAAPPVIANSCCLAWHPDNERLAAATYSDGNIALWSTKTGKIVRRYSIPGSFPVIAFDGRGRELVAGSAWGGYLGVFDVESEKELLSVQASILGAISSGPDVCTRIWIDSADDGTQIWEFFSENVVRQFATNTGAKTLRFIGDDSPDGRWLAVSTDRGIELFDSKTRQLVAELPIGPMVFNRVCFDNASRLWAIVADGWLRWTIRDSGLSAPDFFRASAGFFPVQVSYDGNWMLTTNGTEVKLESLTEPGREVLLGIHADVRNVAFSRDSRFVATGGWNGAGGAKIWRIADGQLVTFLDTGSLCDLKFSPDSRWLFTTPRGGEIWETTDWKIAHRLQSPDSSATGFAFAFSPDSRWLVNSQSNGAIQLWNIQSRVPVGQLQDIYPSRTSCLVFSKDQRQIVSVAKDPPTIIKSWDLARLAQELDFLGIEFPTLSPISNEPSIASNQPGQPTQSRSVDDFKIETNEIYAKLVVAQIQTEALSEMDQNNWQLGLELLEKNRQLCPGESEVLNTLAWSLLVAPLEFQDSQKALQHATTAVAGNDARNFVNTLGIAQYRCGQFETAIETLTKSLGDGASPTAAFDFFALACCQAKLNQRELAKDLLSEGLESQNTHAATFPPSSLRELKLFRAEAESLISASRPRNVESTREPIGETK